MAIAEDLLTTTVSLAPSRATIGVSGELDAYTSPRLRDAASKAMCPDMSLIVDLAEVTFIDSVGLGTLISLAKEVRDRDGEFYLRRPPPSVRRLLEITGLSEALTSTAP